MQTLQRCCCRRTGQLKNILELTANLQLTEKCCISFHMQGGYLHKVLKTQQQKPAALIPKTRDRLKWSYKPQISFWYKNVITISSDFWEVRKSDGMNCIDADWEESVCLFLCVDYTTLTDTWYRFLQVPVSLQYVFMQSMSRKR